MRNAFLTAALATMTIVLAHPAGAEQPGPGGPMRGQQMSNVSYDPHAFAMHVAEHHRHGIALADAVIANGQNAQVKALARRIRSDLQRELATLDAHKTGKSDVSKPGDVRSGDATKPGTINKPGDVGPVPPGRGMGMGMGMRDPEVGRGLMQLENAKGADADRLFLELMIVHHASGVKIVHGAMHHLTENQLKSMARDMFGKQARQIGELQRLRESESAISRK